MPVSSDADDDLVRAALRYLGHLDDPERHMHAHPSDTPRAMRTKAGWVRQVVGALRRAGVTITPPPDPDSTATPVAPDEAPWYRGRCIYCSALPDRAHLNADCPYHNPDDPEGRLFPQYRGPT